jgi:hypothetical protein
MMTRRTGGWERRQEPEHLCERCGYPTIREPYCHKCIVDMAERLPYLVWAYDFSHASAGPKALHRLCHELNVAGQTAYIGPQGWPTNPEWNTPTWQGPLPTGEWIAVYPEVVSGNPWNAPHVARWALNVPGLLGGDRSYPASEMVFAWDRKYLADVPLLQTPTVDLDIYFDQHATRAGALFFVGKGRRDLLRVDGAVQEITLAMRLDRRVLASALNRAEIMYCLDEHTGMVQLALLCGCPVVIVPTGQRLEPTGFLEEYLALAAAFPAQLAAFIEITQRVAVPA